MGGSFGGRPFLLQPQTPKRQTLRVATRAEVAALAREREQILVLARATAHAGEAVLENAAGEILLDHLTDDWPLVSVTVSKPLVVDCYRLVELAILETPRECGRP